MESLNKKTGIQATKYTDDIFQFLDLYRPYGVGKHHNLAQFNAVPQITGDIMEEVVIPAPATKPLIEKKVKKLKI